MNTTSLPDDVLIRIVKFLDFKSKLSFRGVSHRIREICSKYGPKERIVLEHTRERRDPNAPRRVLLAYEDESEYDKVLEGPMFGKASKSAKDLDDVFARIPTDLFEIVEVTTSLSEEKQKERRTRRSDFTLDELCELADKYKKLFNVNRICIDNGDMTDDHQFNEFKHIISVFARPGTDLRLFLGVGGHLKEVIDLMQEKQIQTKLMLLNAESVADVELIQSLLLSEPNGILAEKVHLQMNIIEQIEKDDFVVMMDCFVRRFCEHGKLLIDSVSFDFPSHQQSNYLPEERVRVTYHPSKRCPHVGYQTMIDFRGYTINLVQNIPSLSIPVEKIRGFAIENNQLRIHAKEGIIVHAEVYPVARNLSREADILKQDQVAIYQIRPTDTHVWIWYCLTNSDDSHDIPIGAFHYRHFEEPRVVRSLSDSCPFDLKII